MARAETLDSRVARIEEAILGFKEDRIEARQDRKDILSRLDLMSQAIQSTGAIVQQLSLEKCGERLDTHDKRIEALESRVKDIDGKTANLPALETDLNFWRRVVGAGWGLFWRVAGVLGASGVISALVAHFTK